MLKTKLKSPTDRSLLLFTILITSVFITQINLLSSPVSAIPPPPSGVRDIPGFQFQGGQNKSEGAVQYRFSNNLRFILNSTSNVSLGIEFSENIRDQTLGANITAFEDIDLDVQVSDTFKANARGRTGFFKGGSVPGEPKPAAPRQNPNVEDEEETASDAESNLYEISPLEDLYYSVSFSEGVEEIDLYYNVSEYSQTEDIDLSKVSWAFYDEDSSSWYLVNSSIENDYLTVSLNEVEHAELIGSGDFTLAPVVSNPVSASRWEDPVFKWAIVGLIVVAGIFLLLMTKQDYRNYLLNRVMHINKGVHKHLDMEDVLENENRTAIIDYILEHPGVHFNKLQEAVNVSGGNLAWHLDVLETFKVIKKFRVGQYLTYFPFLEKNPISKLNLELRKSKTTLEILQIVSDNPGIYQSKIAHRLDLNHKTVKYHLDKLMEAEVISSDEKRFKRGYYPNAIIEDEGLLQNSKN